MTQSHISSSDTNPTDTQQSDETIRNPLPDAELSRLPQRLQEACSRAGWADLMPVQKKAIPYLLDGRDIMVQARTGSGKTGAFALPMLELLDPGKDHCQALILVPTRELARQVAAEFAMLAGDSGLRSVAVFGGVGYGKQLEAFKQGVQVVVGTPGRILDHLMSGALNLDRLKVLIFDEADRMLSIGFYPDMKAVQGYLPRSGYAAYMFSATFPQAVLRLADQFLFKPQLISLSGEEIDVADIEHVFYQVPGMGKERVLVSLIEIENPDSAIVFCNTKSEVSFVTAVLKRFGFNAEELSSDLNQSKRERVLDTIKAGGIRFLVATDVVGRGIDIHELSHVFLYDLPEDPESYVHRSGRTGRAGNTGTVISLVDLMQKKELLRIGKRYSIDLLERELPTDEDVAAVVEERMLAKLEARRRDLDALRKERIAPLRNLAAKLAEEEDTRELLAMLLGDVYFDSLQEPSFGPARPARQPQRRTGQGRPAPKQAPKQGPTPGAKPRRRRRRGPRKSGGGGEG